MFSFKNNIICIIFLFCFISWTNSTYLKSSCRPNNSTCHERETSLVNNFTEEEWLKTGCFCDEECSFYEDCCADKVIANKNIPKTRRCTKIKGEPIFIHEIYLCPIDFLDENIKKLCESSNNTFSKIRVTNIKSKTTYSNFYCAICNGENETVITLWNLIVECPSEYFKFSIANYNNSMEQKVESNSSMVESCISNSNDIRLIPPLEMKNYLRRCQPCISSCDKKCQMSPLNYVYHNAQCYRNVFCAICNSVDISNLTCKNNYQEIILNDKISYESYQWKFGLNFNCTEHRVHTSGLARNKTAIFESFDDGSISCSEKGHCLDESGICVPCSRRKRNICFTKYVLYLEPPISKWQLYFDKINIPSDMLSVSEEPIN